MSNKPSLLIIEDEPVISRGLTDLFVYHGYEVESEADGEKGLQLALNIRFSCILLDVMLPTMNGFEICDRIRQKSQSQPILMLTAKKAEQHVVNGLSLGADDYLAKPFSTSELVLRVGALIRRSGWSGQGSIFMIGDNVEICMQTLRGVSHKKKVRYTRREVAILSYLSEQDAHVTREELLKNVWGYKSTDDIDTRTVDIHIAKLRKKIERNPKAPEYLVTLRGEGYQLYTHRVR